jgi:hypothetical protein
MAFPDSFSVQLPNFGCLHKKSNRQQITNDFLAAVQLNFNYIIAA